MTLSNFVPMSEYEVHTESGVEPPRAPGDLRRAWVIAGLVLLAIVGAGVLFVWWSGIAEASAAGGCGG